MKDKLKIVNIMEPQYKLLQDFTDPCGRVKKGVVKTAHQWCARFALLNTKDCDIKKDWFEKVNNSFTEEDMRRCFDQSRLTSPSFHFANIMIGFKHDTFEDFMESNE